MRKFSLQNLDLLSKSYSMLIISASDLGVIPVESESRDSVIHSIFEY